MRSVSTLRCGNNPAAVPDDEGAPYLTLSGDNSVEPGFDGKVHAFYCGLTDLTVAKDELIARSWDAAST
jgi:hypothetical protein